MKSLIEIDLFNTESIILGFEAKERLNNLEKGLLSMLKAKRDRLVAEIEKIDLKSLDSIQGF